MIVVDIETSGVDFHACGIWQVGAIDTDNPEKIFLEDCRIDDTDAVEEGALRVCGKTEEELRDKNKQSCRDLLKNFFVWCTNSNMRNFICQNPQFDTVFLKIKADKYKIYYPFGYHAFDLHSIAAVKYFDIQREFSKSNNASNMVLKNIIIFCGMEDTRTYHNALEDAKLTAECFSRIVYGKKLLEEYAHYDIPRHLI